MGSSIIKQAFAVARRRPGGLDLGLTDFNLWWQGYGGMNLLEVIPKLKLLKKLGGEEPDVILLHCGGNNIGRNPLKSIRWLINQIISFIGINFHAKSFGPQFCHVQFGVTPSIK